jgi:two-component system, LuxR family, response regulator FixJ
MHEIQKVFVVEDDPNLRLSLNRSLQLRGYDVELYSSAEEFLVGFGDGRPGCIILDYGMPGMNGLELQAQLLNSGHKIPIIFITGHAGIPESVQATKAGAIDFLEKPYNPDVLAERVKVALDMDRRHQNTREEQLTLRSSMNELTPRETEIFDLIRQYPERSSSKAIARELDISPRTVDLHRARILEKTQCRTVAELIARFGLD